MEVLYRWLQVCLHRCTTIDSPRVYVQVACQARRAPKFYTRLLMASTNSIATTTTGMRSLLAIAGLLVLIIGLPLYLVPENSDDYFSWSVSPLSATFLGAAYLSAAVIEFSAARRRIWANARIAIPAVFVFTVLTLFVTLGNAEQYHFNAPGFVQSAGTWAWLVVYVVVPPIMLIVVVMQLFRRGRDPVRRSPISSPLRRLFALGGAALLLGGVTMIIDPGAASWIWPWPLTSVTGQASAAWMVGFGIALGQMAWEADWQRVRPATAGVGTLGILQLVAVLRFSDELAWTTARAWVYVAVLVSFAILGVYGSWIAGSDRVNEAAS